MAESNRLVDLIQDAIDDFLDGREPALTAISRDLSPFIDFSRDLLRGGKRFRALFCYWGQRAVRTANEELIDAVDSGNDLRVIVRAASALEFFHAAALVHDDIIDNSDTRRGMSAVHRRYQALHEDADWSGDRAEFGRSAGILHGDLLLAWSEELFVQSLGMLDDRNAARAARAEFDRMRTEVMLGQYLDVLEEQSWNVRPERELLSRAHRVIVYKSAKYTVEAPLTIGAALGGGTPEQLQTLRDFGLPLGIAYQLRDDLLGVFGDPQVTGKPSGDDLREGKRTVLIALARANLPAHAARFLDELLGDRTLDDAQVRMLQTTIRDSGAIDEVEQLIRRNADQAKAALETASLAAGARRELAALADTVTVRSS